MFCAVFEFTLDYVLCKFMISLFCPWTGVVTRGVGDGNYGFLCFEQSASVTMGSWLVGKRANYIFADVHVKLQIDSSLKNNRVCDVVPVAATRTAHGTRVQ
jgi:hypothetical protein